MEHTKATSDSGNKANAVPERENERPCADSIPGVRPLGGVSTERRENILRAVRFGGPGYIPIHFHINEASWHCYPPEALNELMESHSLLFPYCDGTSRGRTELDYTIIERPGKPFVDGWGCRWEATVEGMVGSVTKHPLANWEEFAGYSPPDPQIDSGKGPISWKQIAEDTERARSRGHLTMGGLRHGHTFQTLVDIRGYENLLFDMADGHPNLLCLIEMVEQFNAAIVRRFIDLGVEWMSYPEDLGMQTGLLISPQMFRTFVKPSYERLMKPARDAGCIVHMHSDGWIRDLLEDLIDGDVDVVNLQDVVNGIDWIASHLAGRVCIELDIDRQRITPFGTPRQIDELIREEVTKLGSKEGGLMMIYGLYPGVPLENVKALMDAMERYAGFYA